MFLPEHAPEDIRRFRSLKEAVEVNKWEKEQAKRAALKRAGDARGGDQSSRATAGRGEQNASATSLTTGRADRSERRSVDSSRLSPQQQQQQRQRSRDQEPEDGAEDDTEADQQQEGFSRQHGGLPPYDMSRFGELGHEDPQLARVAADRLRELCEQTVDETVDSATAAKGKILNELMTLCSRRHQTQMVAARQQAAKRYTSLQSKSMFRSQPNTTRVAAEYAHAIRELMSLEHLAALVEETYTEMQRRSAKRSVHARHFGAAHRRVVAPPATSSQILAPDAGSSATASTDQGPASGGAHLEAGGATAMTPTTETRPGVPLQTGPSAATKSESHEFVSFLAQDREARRRAEEAREREERDREEKAKAEGKRLAAELAEAGALGLEAFRRKRQLQLAAKSHGSRPARHRYLQGAYARAGVHMPKQSVEEEYGVPEPLMERMKTYRVQHGGLLYPSFWITPTAGDRGTTSGFVSANTLWPKHASMNMYIPGPMLDLCNILGEAPLQSILDIQPPIVPALLSQKHHLQTPFDSLLSQLYHPHDDRAAAMRLIREVSEETLAAVDDDENADTRDRRLEVLPLGLHVLRNTIHTDPSRATSKMPLASVAEKKQAQAEKQHAAVVSLVTKLLVARKAAKSRAEHASRAPSAASSTSRPSTAMDRTEDETGGGGQDTAAKTSRDGHETVSDLLQEAIAVAERQSEEATTASTWTSAAALASIMEGMESTRDPHPQPLPHDISQRLMAVWEQLRTPKLQQLHLIAKRSCKHYQNRPRAISMELELLLWETLGREYGQFQNAVNLAQFARARAVPELARRCCEIAFQLIHTLHKLLAQTGDTCLVMPPPDPEKASHSPEKTRRTGTRVQTNQPSLDRDARARMRGRKPATRQSAVAASAAAAAALQPTSLAMVVAQQLRAIQALIP